MKGKKILKVIVDVLVWIIIILAASVTLITLTSREKGVSKIFGYVPLNIQTSSMEPTFYPGDLLIAKEYVNEQNGADLKEGDVITFFTVEQNQTIINTHRISRVISVNGMTSFVTKGDNVNHEDEKQVAPGDIIATWDGTRIGHIGSIFTFLKQKVWFFVCIILPLAAFFVYQLYKFIMLILDYKKVK